MGKKKLDVLLPLKAKFIEGYANKFGSKGATKESAEHLWDQMEEFAKYSFNKCLSFDTQILTSYGNERIDELFKQFHESK